jgi:hypothetical protein
MQYIESVLQDWPLNTVHPAAVADWLLQKMAPDSEAPVSEEYRSLDASRGRASP